MLWVKSKLFLWVPIIAAGLSGCGEKTYDPARVRAPSQINESFVVPGSADLVAVADIGRVGINKSSIDKEFLLQTSMITQQAIASFNGMKSRIVAFVRKGATLFMMEATRGHIISNSVPAHFILAEFPILEETGDHIYFDFSDGMKRVFMASDWSGQDFEGPFYKPSWESVPVDVSMIEKVERDRNSLVIHQVTMAAGQQLRLAYYLSPYAPSESFTPLVSEGFDRVGFFEVMPQLRDGRTESVIYATKFDHTKPIKFAISHNTPEEYREAVRDGILYWNKAFGREVLTAEQLEENVSAPNFRHNIVQWVEWDDAGFAYADAQMDPRTGETLHAQVFLTSAFAFGSKARARSILRNLKSQRQNAVHLHSHKRTLFGLKEDDKTPLCHMNTNETLIMGIETMLADAGITDEQVLKISQDYIREVVAHEVGHDLGLRHNFAGSLASRIEAARHEASFRDYVTSGDARLVTTSSVMEYSAFKDAVMSGDLIAKSPNSFQYDTAAIKVLYGGIDIRGEDIPLFCTDSHAGKFVDCMRFDSGSSLVAYNRETELVQRRLIAFNLIENFIAIKTASSYHGDRIKLAKWMLTPQQVAQQVLAGRERTLHMLNAGQKFLAVHRSSEHHGPLNADLLRAEEMAHVRAQMEPYSLEELFENIPNDVVTANFEQFKELLQSDAYMTGIDSTGSSYAFTELEKQLMLDQGEKFFAGLPEAFVNADIQAFQAAAGMDYYDFRDVVGNILHDKAWAILDAVARYEVHRDVFEPGDQIELPIFAHGQATRLAAVKAFAVKAADPTWMANYRYEAKVKLFAQIVEVMGRQPKTIARESLPPAVQIWFENAIQVIGALK